MAVLGTFTTHFVATKHSKMSEAYIYM